MLTRKLLCLFEDLLYPLKVNCISCGVTCAHADDWLCDDCLSALNEAFGAYSPRANVIAAYPYGSVAGSLVRSLKYRGYGLLAGRMSRDMLRAFEMSRAPAPDVVAYVPMNIGRRLARYNNHALLLARGVAANFGLLPVDALERVRSGKAQARITDDAERAANISGAFAARMRLDGKRVLLIDDVFTTGATTSECARVLREAGASEVYVLAYAAARV